MSNIKRCKAICKFGDGTNCNYQDVELDEEGRCLDRIIPTEKPEPNCRICGKPISECEGKVSD